MPPKKTSPTITRNDSLERGITTSLNDFCYLCKSRPDRIGIVSEGDSWFAYPRKWIAFGADINIIHHLAEKIENTDRVNLLRLASNGDEAVDMTSGKQFKKLYRILKRNRQNIRLLLFSGGGNDLVGKDNLLPLLNDYQGSRNFKDCLNLTRLEQKLDSITLSYLRLIALCEDLVPDAKIITHTYDIAKPWNQGAKFFWGLIETKPWVYPYLIRRKIPEKFHLPIIKYMLTQLGTRLKKLERSRETKGRLVVVQTQGTLRPGSQKDWLNEIHPTKEGFHKIFKKIYRQMRIHQPDLPA